MIEKLSLCIQLNLQSLRQIIALLILYFYNFIYINFRFNPSESCFFEHSWIANVNQMQRQATRFKDDNVLLKDFINLFWNWWTCLLSPFCIWNEQHNGDSISSLSLWEVFLSGHTWFSMKKNLYMNLSTQ